MPQLNFKGKTAVENYHYTIPHHTLEFDEKLSVLGKGTKPSLDGNLIIEGDNLIALKALLPTHAGRIKCIYIDPPYNTGNEGWVYNDNLTQPQFKEWIGKTVGKEGEDASRHDKWCCMMYPRLQVLKELLHDKGLIFISIDQNEVSHLTMLMDEIFGENNRIGQLVWKARNFTDTRTKTGLSTDHEYLLSYRKTEAGRLTGKRRDEGKYDNPDNDPRGPWTSCSLLGKATREQRPNLHYTFTNPKTGASYPPSPETGWICRPESMQQKIAEKRILWPKKENGRPREKVFLNELLSGTIGFPSVIDGIFTSDGTEELREIFGEQVFDFPKPSILVRDIIEQMPSDDDDLIVLDSFAGSGTTGHATLRLNQLDQKNRKFILIQSRNDNKAEDNKLNICKDLTRERVKRVIAGYNVKGEKGKATQVPGLPGDFTYARIAAPVMDEHRTFGQKRPEFDVLAQYIFYTETNRPIDAGKVNKKSGFIGAHGDSSLYLLYKPDSAEGLAITTEWLEQFAKSDKNKTIVIYCEKIWVHRDDREAFEKRTGKSIRVMQLPFHLK